MSRLPEIEQLLLENVIRVDSSISHHFIDGCHQFVIIKGLDHVDLCAAGITGLFVIHSAFCSQEYDFGLFQKGHLPDFLSQFKAIHARHHNIQNYDIGLKINYFFECLEAIVSFFGVVAFSLKQKIYGQNDVRLIIHDEDFCGICGLIQSCDVLIQISV